MSSASYRTFVHILRSRRRGPIYGMQMSPIGHTTQVIPVPSMPTMANLPAYAAVTPPVITPPKRPRFLASAETPPVEQSFAQPLEFRLVGMSHTSVTFQSNSNRMPNPVKEPLGNVSSTKRKMKEQVKIPSNSVQPQQIVKPKVPQQLSIRMEKPRNLQINYQKYFPPGPEKVIRTPVDILKREYFHLLLDLLGIKGQHLIVQ